MRTLTLSLAPLAALVPLLAAQEPPPPLPAAFFASRRQAVMELVKEKSAEGEHAVVVLRGAPPRPDMAAFYQDHDFYYLSGVAEPGVAMLLDPATGAEELLVPPFQRFTATWEGERLVPGAAAAERTGFATVGNVRGLQRRLEELLRPASGQVVVWTFLEPQPNETATPGSAAGAAQRRQEDPLDGRPTRERALQTWIETTFPGVGVRDLTPLTGQLRAVKTQDEIAQIRAASAIAAQGIAEAIAGTHPGIWEFQIAAAARYVFTRLGAGPDAYAPIVGSGPNGCVLHYSANRRRTEPGDLVVMDYAPTVNGYCADVTRTFPVSGSFTPEQRRLVADIVEVQQALIAHVKPGESLSRLSALAGQLLREKGYGVDHGPCHHVGLAVHDKQGDVLEAGMVITVEPGAYLRDKGMGCRIEDTVLVTADGCENLSGHLPAHPDAIEALMRGDGVQQRAVGLPRN